jgi:hypothetical protein
MNQAIRNYLAEIGKRGGAKSRRRLDSRTARDMVRIREARRAFRRFHTQCFWSTDPDFRITLDNIDWVVEQLMKNGNRITWEIGAKLCR